MARIKPKLSPESLTSAREPYEIKLYQTFQTFKDPDWLILYNVAYIDRRWQGSPPIDGEIDFLVVHPSWGVLTIEVKGGRMRWDGSKLWNGGVPCDIDAQVREQKFGMRSRLMRRPDWDPNWNRDVEYRIGHAYAFLNGSYKSAPMPSYIDKNILIDETDLPGLEARRSQETRRAAGPMYSRLNDQPLQGPRIPDRHRYRTRHRVRVSPQPRRTLLRCLLPRQADSLSSQLGHSHRAIPQRRQKAHTRLILVANLVS